jgi:hypothetical protein
MFEPISSDDPGAIGPAMTGLITPGHIFPGGRT